MNNRFMIAFLVLGVLITELLPPNSASAQTKRSVSVTQRVGSTSALASQLKTEPLRSWSPYFRQLQQRQESQPIQFGFPPQLRLSGQQTLLTNNSNINAMRIRWTASANYRPRN